MITILFWLGALSSTGDFQLEARNIKSSELSPKHFDVQWRLPAKRKEKGRDLLSEMERLAALRFEAKDAAGRRYRSLGDLIGAARLESNRSKWLAGVLKSAPKLESDWGAALRELLLDGTLRKADWDPEDNSAKDGLLLAPSWKLEEEGAPWNGLEVNPRAQQGAVVIRADLAKIKQAENDYRTYPDIPGASYEEIYPLGNSYVKCEDESGRCFSSLRLYFRSELPLWYPDYSCDLRLLNWVDQGGRLNCDIYSTSEDFHWLAGRDVYLPLERTTAGEAQSERAGYLVVRQYGFDLDGVPDGEDNVQSALRQSLGSLKRNAEALAGREGSARADSGPARVPEFEVWGSR